MLNKSFIFTVLLSITNLAHGEIQCATGDVIENLSKDEAIDAAYKSGPSGGNYGNEVEYGGEEIGIMFLSKQHTKGNLDLLDLYPTLNLEVLQNMGTSEEKTIGLDYRYHHAGMFKPTYNQSRECRRQVFITGVAEGAKAEIYNREFKSGDFGVEDRTGNTRYFTGWLNVELCSPGAKGLFYKAAEAFESQGKKVETIHTFLDFVKANILPHIEKEANEADAEVVKLKGAENPDSEKIKAAEVDFELKNERARSMRRLVRLLNPEGDANIYYAKMPYQINGKTVTGHIGPRFSIKMKKMFFLSNKEKTACRMKIVPSHDYAGLLDYELHEFSEDIQSFAFNDVRVDSERRNYVEKLYEEGEDNRPDRNSFYMNYFTDEGRLGSRKAFVNKSLNTPPQ